MMTVQHLPLHEAERTEGHLYQERSLLLRSSEAAAFSTRGILNPALEPNVSSDPTFFSLWLIPPPSVAPELEQEISYYSKTAGGPTFDPHVTVLGGIAFDSIDDAKKFVNRLQDELRGFGEVEATFEKEAKNFDVWSQALVVEMEANAKFVYLCQIVRRMLGMDTTNLFPAPVKAPHLSLFYGVENAPDAADVPPIPNFSSHRLELWKTYPTATEGVPEWQFFDEISLA